MLMEDAFKGLLTTKQAGERVGMHYTNVLRLLEHGKIKGVKVGRDWLVDPESLDHYATTKGWAKARRKKARAVKAQQSA
jgi:excisionase family DNA binding protein